MAEMTVAQVGQRRASKKNNRLRRDMPLFAEALQPGGTMADWLTTAERETRAVEEGRRRAADNLAALVAAKQERAEREAELRAEAMAGKSADDAAFLDERRRIYPDDPSYGIELWRRVIAQPDWVEVERQRLAKIHAAAAEWRRKLAERGGR